MKSKQGNRPYLSKKTLILGITTVSLAIAFSQLIAPNAVGLIANTMPDNNSVQVQEMASAEALRKGDENTKTVEDIVRETYVDVPVLAEVARCESTFRQTLPNGNILRGTVNKYDVGVMQINELYHKEKALELGYDLYSIEGNLGYARYLYDREGTRPWMASSGCWSHFSLRDVAKKTDSSQVRL